MKKRSRKKNDSRARLRPGKRQVVAAISLALCMMLGGVAMAHRRSLFGSNKPAPTPNPAATPVAAAPAPQSQAPALAKEYIYLGGRLIATEESPGVPPSSDNATFVSQTPPPASMSAGQVVNVSVTMRNSGTTTWTTPGYKLRSQNPAGNATWGVIEIALPSPGSVNAGSQAVFSFNVTAPSTAGSYNFQWQMYKDGTGYFGGPSANAVVTVGSGGGGGGLVGFWKFDEGGGLAAADSSGNGNNGTLVNGPVWSAGKVGSALNFDGVDDQVIVASGSSIRDVTNNFTLAFWVNPQSTHEIDAESTVGYGGLSGQKFAIGPRHGSAEWGTSDHAGAGVSVGTNGVSVYEHSDNYIPSLLSYQGALNGWTHVALVYENRQPKLYVNGSLVRTGLLSPKSFVHIKPDQIGNASYGAFRGLMDEVRIYNRVLSAGEIQNLSGPPTLPPPAPSGLTATPGDTQVTLLWQASTGATSYNVKKSTTSGGPYSLVQAGITNTTFNVTGLTNGTPYYFVVTASNSGGESGNSNQASATPAGQGGGQIYFNGTCGLVQPGFITIGCDPANEFPGTMFDRTFTVSYAAGDTVQVRMFNVDDHAYVYVNGVLRGSADYAQDKTVTLSSFMLPGANTVQLLLVNDNYTPWSYGFTLTKTGGGCSGAPAGPTGLTATAGNSQVTLNWNAVSGATSYNVKYSTINGGPYTSQSGITGASYIKTGLTNGTTYYFVVSASNCGGEGPNSTQVNAVPTSGPTPPPAPTGLTASAGNTQVTLNWSAAPGATSYNVKYSTINGGPYTVQTGIAGTSHIKTGLINGTTYYFVVSASNSAGEGPNSAQVSAMPTAGPTPPPAPTGLTASPGNGQVTLNWGVTSGATSYNVKYSTISGGPYTVQPGIAGTSYIKTGLINGTTYYFVVSATNSAGEGPNSAQVSATPAGGGGGCSCSQLSLFSGNGVYGYLEGAGSAAQWAAPAGGAVAREPVGGYQSLFVADMENHRVRMIYLEGPNTGLSVWIAGRGVAGYHNGSGNALNAKLNFPHGVGAITDGSGVITALLIADTDNHMIRKITPPATAGGNWSIANVAGQPGIPGFGDGDASINTFNSPRNVVQALDGLLYVADATNSAIRRLDLAGNCSTLVSGGGIRLPVGITVSRASGLLYFVDSTDHSVWKLTLSGVPTRIAGNGASGSTDGTGAAARFNKPYHVSWGNAGGGELLFIADRTNNKVRKLEIATNAVSTYAGTGVAGYLEGGCSSAQFNQLRGIAVGPGCDVYVIDTLNNRIRKISP